MPYLLVTTHQHEISHTQLFESLSSACKAGVSCRLPDLAGCIEAFQTRGAYPWVEELREHVRQGNWNAAYQAIPQPLPVQSSLEMQILEVNPPAKTFRPLDGDLELFALLEEARAPLG